MKNINKMRIIYPAEFNAEKEYLKTFFDYIGILVYDEKILNSQYHSVWYKHLKMNNDSDGVDIVLNYYTNGDVPIPAYNKRIYLYFDLEEKICEISTKPLPNPKYLLNSENSKLSKKDLRSKLLDLLIDEIWRDDLKNKDAIKLIKECYLPQNKDIDLFYILQAIYSYIDVSNSYIINDHNNKMEDLGQRKSVIETKLCLDDYTKSFFQELWRVQCLVKDNNSPYAIYTTINNSSLLLSLYSNLSEFSKEHFPYIDFNGTLLQINPYKAISYQIYNLIKKCPWFTNAIYMGIKFGIENENIYTYLLNCINKSSFPVYYSSVYNALGYRYIKEKRNNKQSMEMFKKKLELNPENFDANFRIGLFETSEGNFAAGNHYFDKILMNSGANENYNLFSLSELLKGFQANIMKSKIAINSCREYTARANVISALLKAEYYEDIPLIKRLADNDEKAYQDFIKYHKYSAPVYTLYSYLKMWVNGVINDYASKDILQKRLSKWK